MTRRPHGRPIAQPDQHLRERARPREHRRVAAVELDRLDAEPLPRGPPRPGRRDGAVVAGEQVARGHVRQRRERARLGARPPALRAQPPHGGLGERARAVRVQAGDRRLGVGPEGPLQLVAGHGDVPSRARRSPRRRGAGRRGSGRAAGSARRGRRGAAPAARRDERDRQAGERVADEDDVVVDGGEGTHDDVRVGRRAGVRVVARRSTATAPWPRASSSAASWSKHHAPCQAPWTRANVTTGAYRTRRRQPGAHVVAASARSSIARQAGKTNGASVARP